MIMEIENGTSRNGMNVRIEWNQFGDKNELDEA